METRHQLLLENWDEVDGEDERVWTGGKSIWAEAPLYFFPSSLSLIFKSFFLHHFSLSSVLAAKALMPMRFPGLASSPTPASFPLSQNSPGLTWCTVPLLFPILGGSFSWFRRLDVLLARCHFLQLPSKINNKQLLFSSFRLFFTFDDNPKRDDSLERLWVEKIQRLALILDLIDLGSILISLFAFKSSVIKRSKITWIHWFALALSWDDFLLVVVVVVVRRQRPSFRRTSVRTEKLLRKDERRLFQQLERETEREKERTCRGGHLDNGGNKTLLTQKVMLYSFLSLSLSLCPLISHQHIHALSLFLYV